MFKTAQEHRIAITYKAGNVPGEPIGRAQRIADDFTTSQYSRRFNGGVDFVHLPTDYDIHTSRQIWLLCDFNIRDRRSEAKKNSVRILDGALR